MLTQRASGILAHITSLPSAQGIGDIGPSSYEFINFLVESGQSYWQFLPTGPTNELFDHSPYMSISAFAGSPLLISPDLLFQEGLLSHAEIQNRPEFSKYSTDFIEVTKHKDVLLRKAFKRFKPETSLEYEDFIERSGWLDDYAMFMVIKHLLKNSGWFDWPKELATRDMSVLKKILDRHIEEIEYFRFEQFVYYKQWRQLHAHAVEHGINLIGDLPIYVSYDSVDVWANQTIFSLDPKSLKPTKVSGVPPDYFSTTGQRWGNPLYDWHNPNSDVQKNLLAWWTRRLSHLFNLVDTARIDHFRGFESYWAIPEANETAVDGEWVKGPGAEFFKSIFSQLGKLEIIAEDLGIITKEVETLRDEFNFPGMKVLQFAFDGNKENSFLPYNFTSSHCVVYTGTHDNDTTVGWYLSEKNNDELRSLIKKTANRSLHDHTGIHNDMMYLAQSSIAALCIFPLQDILGFGNDCRMNTPGTSKGNWRWRCAKEFLTTELAEQLKSSCELFGRGRKQ